MLSTYRNQLNWKKKNYREAYLGRNSLSLIRIDESRGLLVCLDLNVLLAVLL